MLGAQLRYDNRTIWVHPTVESILDADLDALSMDHPEVQRMIAQLSYCAKQAAGEAFIALPPMGNPGDTLAMTGGNPARPKAHINEAFTEKREPCRL